MDYRSFSAYYDAIVEPVLKEYSETNAELVLRPNGKEAVWREYCVLNEACKRQYMRDQAHLIDRHKVVACYMYAVLRAHIVCSVISLREGDDTHLMLNERLAVCFGMSVFRALLMDIANELPDDETLKTKAIAAFEDDFSFPECNHGTYIDNLRSQLYFTRRNGNYNVLALAETLFFIEVYNLMKNNLPVCLFKLRR